MEIKRNLAHTVDRYVLLTQNCHCVQSDTNTNLYHKKEVQIARLHSAADYQQQHIIFKHEKLSKLDRNFCYTYPYYIIDSQPESSSQAEFVTRVVWQFDVKFLL